MSTFFYWALDDGSLDHNGLLGLAPDRLGAVDRRHLLHRLHRHRHRLHLHRLCAVGLASCADDVARRHDLARSRRRVGLRLCGCQRSTGPFDAAPSTRVEERPKENCLTSTRCRT